MSTRYQKMFLADLLLLFALSAFASDPSASLETFDRVIMRIPPAPLKWQTNLTSLIAEAEKGDTNAECDLGLHYIFAFGTPQRLDKALYWVTKAADHNYPPAEYTLGLMYKCGVGVVSNQALADEWFKKATELRTYTPAKHELALAADRKGNRVEALKLLQEAAESGFPSSQYLMGCIATNVIEQYAWYSLAAPNVEIAGTRVLELRQILTKDQLTEAEERIRKLQQKRAAMQHPLNIETGHREQEPQK